MITQTFTPQQTRVILNQFKEINNNVCWLSLHYKDAEFDMYVKRFASLAGEDKFIMEGGCIISSDFRKTSDEYQASKKLMGDIFGDEAFDETGELKSDKTRTILFKKPMNDVLDAIANYLVSQAENVISEKQRLIESIGKAPKRKAAAFQVTERDHNAFGFAGGLPRS